MEWAVFVLCGVATSAAVYFTLNGLRERYHWRELLRRLSDDSDFECVPSGTGQFAWARGRIRGFDVEIRAFGQSALSHRASNAFVCVHLNLPHEVRMVSREANGPGPYQTECVDFDGVVTLSGPEMHTLSVLNTATRQRVRHVIHQGGRIEHSMLYFPINLGRDHSGGVRAHVDRALKLAQILSRNTDLIERLISILDTESNIHVRQRILGVLKRDVSRDPRFFALARSLLDSPRVGEQLFALDVLGAEGAGTAETIAQNAQVDVESRGRAIRSLVKGLSAHDVVPALQRVAHGVDHDLVADMVWACRAVEDWSAYEVLKECLGDQNPAFSIWESDYLVATRPPNAEQKCLHLLGDPTAEVAESAAIALGTLGTHMSLSALVHMHRTTGSARLRAACEMSLKKVRERSSNSEAGQLSFVEEMNDGALSILEGESAGEVPEA